jgi:hypothetical protein
MLYNCNRSETSHRERNTGVLLLHYVTDDRKKPEASGMKLIREVRNYAMFGQAGQRKISVSCRIGCVASPKDYIYFVLNDCNGLLSYDTC